MPNEIRNLATQAVDLENDLIIDYNVDIPIPGGTDGKNQLEEGVVRGNLYRSQSDGEKGVKFPVLVTYGPYGKDVPYEDFNIKSFNDVPEQQKSKYSSWETPEPTYWCKYGYAILRVDERGLGQSPGKLAINNITGQTAWDFKHVIEWAAQQNWSSGKVGLLGVSYYAITQWQVAALRPKGLTAMIPWEGATDAYRDAFHHGGIASNGFIKWWFNRQVAPTQYGLPGRAERKWGPDTLEGDLSEEELKANRTFEPIRGVTQKYNSDPFWVSASFELEKIEVPFLSVGNLGGIGLHLRGNIEGFTRAGSKQKWLRFLTGRHDLPFYLPEWVELQKGFLDAFLKNEDRFGWLSPTSPPPKVMVCLREGDPGINTVEGERTFKFRPEPSWPLPGTEYKKWNLTSDLGLEIGEGKGDGPETVLTYPALSSDTTHTFFTNPFESDTEITGHVLARLTVSASQSNASSPPKDIDIFVTLRHYHAGSPPNLKEIVYTGSFGDPVPVCKGWLRVSLSQSLDEKSVAHKPYFPRREYDEKNKIDVESGKKYVVDVELWPTSVVVKKGERLGFEVSSADTAGSGIFTHDSPEDRSPSVFAGNNHLHLNGSDSENHLILPVIPPR